MRALHCGFASLALVLLPHCGGGTATGAEPSSAAHETKGPTHTKGDSAKGARADADESASDSATAPEAPSGPNCDDGTCSPCGGGICPSGWYCDEKAGANGACSWLAECAEKPTCSCVTRVLGSSCKCHEAGGGLKVACD